MTDTSNPESREPTQSDAMAIGVAGSGAVDPDTQTAQEAQQASREAMSRRARELRVRLDDNALDEMAARFIEALKQAGAFKDDSQETTPAAGAQQAEDNPPAQPAAPPPVKKTLAQKLLGDR